MLTAVAVAPKVALAAPAAIVTEAGTVTALLLFDKLTVVAVVAAALSVTVQESVAAPVNELLLHETALSAAGAADDDGFNCRVVVSEMPFDVAVSVTVCVALTADTVAVNGSLVSWVHTYMTEGTLTDALLLLRLTGRMPDVLRFIVTVQVVVPALLKAPGLHDTPESTAEEPKEASGKQANNRVSRPARRDRRKPR